MMKQFEIFSLGSKEQQHILGGTELGEDNSPFTHICNSGNGNHGGPYSANTSEFTLQSGVGYGDGHSHGHYGGHGHGNPGNSDPNPSSPFIEELMPYAGGSNPPRP